MNLHSAVRYKSAMWLPTVVYEEDCLSLPRRRKNIMRMVGLSQEAPEKICDICEGQMTYLASLPPANASLPVRHLYKCFRCNFATPVVASRDHAASLKAPDPVAD
jgi:hypothetical protein